MLLRYFVAILVDIYIHLADYQPFRPDDPILRSYYSLSASGSKQPHQPAAPFAPVPDSSLCDIMSSPISAIKRRACVACTTAKAKCTPQAANLCQRCARLGKSCTYLDLPQTKRKQRQKAAPRYSLF